MASHRSVSRVSLFVLLASVLLGWVCERANGQTIIYVNAAAPAGGDGQSWGTAYNDLQPALDAASIVPEATRNIEVWMAAGTYRPSKRATPVDPRSATFTLLNGVTVYGGFIGSETQRINRDFRTNICTLSGDLAGDDATNSTRSDNAYNVVTASSTIASAVLDGVTVTAGNSTSDGGGLTTRGGGNPVIRNCTFIDNAADGDGGGVILGQPGTPVLINCRFLGNRANYGGAISVGVYFGTQSTLTATIYGCEFSGNYAATGGGAASVTGASITPFSPHIFADFNLCSFSNNFRSTTGQTYSSMIFVNRRARVRFINSVHSGHLNPVVYLYRDQTNHSPPELQVINSNFPGQVFILNSSIYSIDGSSTTADPLLANPNGPDAVEGTLDDNLALSVDSSAIDAVDPSQVQSGYSLSDVGGNRRVSDGDGNTIARPDRGAREFGASAYTPRLFANAALTTGRNDGSDWANAFRGPLSLQNALDFMSAAPVGAYSEIWMARGTYKPAGPGGSRSASFQLQNNLAIYGGFTGTETTLSQRNIAANPTILSGDLNGDDNQSINRADNSYHVVTALGVNATAILDGLTIESGHADQTNDVLVSTSQGGGIYIDRGSPTIRSCRIRLNSAYHGAGCSNF